MMAVSSHGLGASHFPALCPTSSAHSHITTRTMWSLARVDHVVHHLPPLPSLWMWMLFSPEEFKGPWKLVY